MMKFLLVAVSFASLLTVPSLVGALPTGVQNSTISSIAREVAIEEPSYEGFNFPADDALRANISAAFVDTSALINTVIDSAAWNSPTFDLYFPSEHREGVALTFRNMLNARTTFVFDNYPRPDPHDPQRRDACVSHDGWAAFTNNEPSAIHTCPKLFSDYPTLGSIVSKVCALPKMATNMRFQGSILFHEVSHITPFHPGRHVRDVGYGPVTVQKIRRDTPFEAINNADSYMWFALVQNPPPPSFSSPLRSMVIS
ncbi:MAG: hypothetical protein Q9169_005621 [Polycauliona sp. 2 TL-2023]